MHTKSLAKLLICLVGQVQLILRIDDDFLLFTCAMKFQILISPVTV
jgi:hypothetical protein